MQSLVIALGIVLSVSNQQSVDSTTPKEQFEALVREQDAEIQRMYDMRKAFFEAETEEERDKIRAMGQPRIIEFADSFLKLAKDHPDDPIAVDALLRASSYSNLHGPERAKAIEILLRDYIEDERIAPLPAKLLATHDPYPGLQRILEKNPHREVWGQAYFWQASGRKKQAEFVRRLNAPELYPNDAAALRGYSGAETFERRRAEDPVQLAEEAERLFEVVIADYNDLPHPHQNNATLGDIAETELYELRHLSLGQAAPEIEGETIDGQPMKLSDFRGKVVVIDFWGTWCGVCMDAKPHERILVERMEGKPFAMVGVNSDEDREKVKQVSEREGITWPSWWDGGSPDGPIARKWNVRGWPTLYVLDAEGVIRFKNVQGPALDMAVDRLIGTMKGAKP